MARRKKVSTAAPLLLSVTDVATMMGVCRQTVYNYIYHEGLPTLLIRGIRRIDPAAFKKWLGEHQAVTPA
jgi:Helix-turn-helix domain